VEDHIDDGGLGPLCRFDQGALDRFKIVDGVRVAVEQLEKQVPSQRVQSTVPPLTDPAIYRTSPATSPHVAVWVAKKVFGHRRNLFHSRVRVTPLQEKNTFAPRFGRHGASTPPLRVSLTTPETPF
jgi:hypothetical protein